MQEFDLKLKQVPICDESYENQMLKSISTKFKKVVI
jgi:hypothetical protein